MKRPGIKQQVARCFSKSAHHYDDHADLQRTVGDRLIRLLINYVSPVSIHSALDLGLGTGMVTHRLLTQTENLIRLTACDLSYEMLCLARERLNDRENKINFIQADFDYLPINESLESYDLIFSNMSLQWSENISSLILSLQKFLSPGGCLAFSVPLRFHHPAFELPFAFSHSYTQFKNSFNFTFIETHEQSFETLYDFIQFYKKTGANFYEKNCKNGILNKNVINRKNYTSLSMRLDSVLIDIGYVILCNDTLLPVQTRGLAKRH